MKLSELSSAFLLEMVQSMFRYEAKDLRNDPWLLTEPEMFQFYMAYMGYPL